MKEFVVKKSESGQSLEKYTKKVLPKVPLGYIEKLFRKKDIKINGHWQDKKAVVNENDKVSIYITDNDYDKFNSDTKEVVANHSAFIGTFNNNDLYYLMSRGIDKKNAYKLLIKSVLLSNMKLDTNTFLNSISDFIGVGGENNE